MGKLPRTSTRKRSPSERLRTQGSKRRRAERNQIAVEQNWKCHYCTTPLSETTATIEHVVPLSRGGTNHRSNKVVACSKCNLERAPRCSAPLGVEIRMKSGTIDEICAHDVSVHVEQMSADGWYMGITAKDGSYWQFWFGAKNRRSAVEFRHTETTTAAEFAELRGKQ